MDKVLIHLFGILKTVGMAVLGLVIAYLLSPILGEDVMSFGGTPIIGAILFAGIPFGWKVFGKVFKFLTISGGAGIAIYIALTFVCSAMVGWAIMTFQLCKDLVGLVSALVSLCKPV